MRGLSRIAQEGVKQRSDDGRDIPSLQERAAARAVIFTAFNFLESLLTDLTLKRIGEGPTRCGHCDTGIQRDIEQGRTEFANMLRTWPLMVLGKCLEGGPGFAQANRLRATRNKLIHIKLADVDKREDLQTEMLLEANAKDARWFLKEACKMAKGMYEAYGFPVPPEITAALV